MGGICDHLINISAVMGLFYFYESFVNFEYM